jgi:hypothetical protein
MKNRSNLLILLPIILAAILGCSSVRGLLPKKGQFFEGDAAQKAAMAVKDKIGKPFRVIEVFIDEKEFRVQAQDPGNPKNVDEYKYIGGFVTGPSPVKLSGMNSDVEKSSFPFDDIDFGAVSKFTQEAMAKAGIDGPKISRLTFQRGFALTEKSAGALGDPRWLIEIEGARENVTASADPKGKLLGVDLSRTSKANDYSIFNKEELQKAQSAIKEHFGDKPQIVEIVMYDKYLMFKTPNPENPKVGDDYKFDINGLARTGIIKTAVMLMPGQEAFSISDIDLSKAAELVEKAKSLVELPDASVGSFTIRRSKSPFDQKGFRTLWDVSLKSGVKEGSVDYDNDGNQIRVRKNGQDIFKEK